ncbi:MAG: carboxypeptidase regulatory-like domain-containing protein [Acidobacteriota bacterium]
MKRVLSGVTGAVLLVLLIAAGASAQATAQISGAVKDSSGGVLPGADVTATQTETGFKRSVVTGADGLFSFPGVPIGPYRLEVALAGFSSYNQTGIVLQVGSAPNIPVTLALGTVAESVTVSGEAPLIDTGKLGIGQVMDNKRIMDLPLNGRNAADLIQLLPAVIPQPGLNATSRSMQGGQAYSVAGGVAFGVAYVLDGATHNNPYDNLNLPLPFPDALQEFRAETSALTAQNGFHSGASVNVVTKSGTNSFRGDAFEFLRHHSLNATDPFAAKDASGNRKDDGLKRNQYGATLGGPIKTDKLFFFAGFQGTNTRVNPTDNRAFVPTAAMLNGDFTAFASAACNAGTAKNLGAPFVGNRVDPALFSKAALSITSRLPTTTDPCGLVQFGQPSSTDDQQYVGKVDFQISSKHSLFARYIGTQVVTPPPFGLKESEQNLLVTRTGGRDNLAQTFTVGENFVISPTTLNAVRFAFNRTAIHRTSTDFFSAPEVGINIYSYRPHYMLLTVTNGFSLGGGTESESNFTTNAWQLSDDVTLVRGAHQFALGVNLAHWTSLSLANVRSPGQFSVDGTQTGGAANSTGLSDFLLGRLGTNGLVQSAPNTLDMQQTYIGVYAQDTWRASSRVTLNYGLRWEPFLPQQLVNGAVYQFDMTRFTQNVHSTVFPKGPAGLYFPGDTGFPSQAGMEKQWTNFGPRVGLAWDPTGTGRMSVRAAFGRSYEFVNGQFHLNTSVAPPWGSEIRLNAPPGGLDDPFLGSPGGNTNIFPVTFDQNAPFSVNGPFLSLSDNMTSTHVDMWNVSVERQLGARWLASVGYVGSRTSNLWESTPLNNGLFIPVNGAAPSAANLNARRPFFLADPDNGKYYGPTDLYVTDGSQRYKGLLLSIRGSGRYGSSINANYTVSNCFGSPDGNGGATTNVSTGYNIPSNPGFDDGNCSSDRLQNFSVTGAIQSPRFNHAGLRAAFTDWRLAGSFRALTGPWLSITTGADIAQNGQAGTQRASVVPGIDPYGDQSTNAANGGIRFLNPLAFVQPAAGTLGDSVRNSVRGPGSKTMDLALSRSFGIGGQRNVEFRLEAFNALNWFQLGAPSTARNSATFGQITSAVNPRVLQVAAKYAF